MRLKVPLNRYKKNEILFNFARVDLLVDLLLLAVSLILNFLILPVKSPDLLIKINDCSWCHYFLSYSIINIKHLILFKQYFACMEHINISSEFAVRAAIFGALYIILGKRVWFFPNILAEEATLRELFRFCPQKDEEERPKWTTRIFYAVLAVLVILLMRHHAPDETARARSVLHLFS